MGDTPSPYWYVRWAFQRGLGLVYLIAFLVAANQFKALLGEHGLLPVPIFVREVHFLDSPSLFFLYPHDIAFAVAAWLGVALALLALTGISERFATWVSATIWALLWVLYLSFVNVGQVFYGFGWESMLLETGFLAIFLGARRSSADAIVIWIIRWELFRVMFGAGMIKMRGDSCWRDLTCLDYHYETQPMPNPLSWYFHWAPEWTHRGGVLFNHFVELVVPFFYFAPRRIARIAGLLTIAFQALLMLSGNLSFLNLLTMVLAIGVLDDDLLAKVVRIRAPEVRETFFYQRLPAVALLLMVVVLSVQPALNIISPHQAMNAAYNPLHLINTYGAFGSVTHERMEVVIEGTNDGQTWREYEFKGKPGDVASAPPQIAPYHLRIDWLMWFAAMGSWNHHGWFPNLVAKLLQGDEAALALLKTNPFPGHPPRYIRALVYQYHFTTPEDRERTGFWWTRELAGGYFPAVSMDDPAFRDLLQQQGWL